MQSEFDRARWAALLQTTLICLALEGILLLALRLVTDTFLEAAAVSIFLIGPISIWVSRPLYRYLLRENQ